jgi:hypothetical protein
VLEVRSLRLISSLCRLSLDVISRRDLEI